MLSKKRLNAVYIIVLTAVLACLLVLTVAFSQPEDDETPTADEVSAANEILPADAGKLKNEIPLTVKITGNTVTRMIKPWYGDDGKWYFFLPSYATNENTELSIDGTGCRFQDDLFSNNRFLDSVEMEKEYSFEQHSPDKDLNTTIVFLKSADVASMYIDTRSGSMDEVNSNKETKLGVNLYLYTEDGELSYQSVEYADEIRGHGNSTWSYDKKSYNLSLNSPAKLITDDENKSYILISNVKDKSNMRNRIVYDLAKDTLPWWNVSTKYVDLFINGDYRGLYLLIDKIEIGKNKLDISDHSFLYNLELQSRVKDGAIQDLLPGIAAELKNAKTHNATEEKAAKALVIKIFDMITKSKIRDDELSSLIDIDSWASLYICQEFSANIDSGNCSLYFYLKGGKLYAGPLWDYDYTFGQRKEFPADTFCARNSRLWYLLTKYDSFNSRVAELFKDQFLPAIDDIIDKKYNELSESIKSANNLDHFRWQSLRFSIFNPDYNDDFIDYIKIRRDFLISAWINKDKYVSVSVNVGEATVNYSVKYNDTGEKIKQSLLHLYGIGEDVQYFDKKTDLEFDLSQPITENVSLHL